MERFRMEDFAKKLEEMEQNPQIQKLKQFPQHDGNNTFQHCHNVAVYSFIWLSVYSGISMWRVL